MAKYYPDIAKGAKGTFVSFVRFLFSKVYSFLRKQKRVISSPLSREDLDVVSHVLSLIIFF